MPIFFQFIKDFVPAFPSAWSVLAPSCCMPLSCQTCLSFIHPQPHHHHYITIIIVTNIDQVFIKYPELSFSIVSMLTHFLLTSTVWSGLNYYLLFYKWGSLDTGGVTCLRSSSWDRAEMWISTDTRNMYLIIVSLRPPKLKKPSSHLLSHHLV